MISIQQLLKALKKLQKITNNNNNKFNESIFSTTTLEKITPQLMTSLLLNENIQQQQQISTAGTKNNTSVTTYKKSPQQQQEHEQQQQLINLSSSQQLQKSTKNFIVNLLLAANGSFYKQVTAKRLFECDFHVISSLLLQQQQQQQKEEGKGKLYINYYYRQKQQQKQKQIQNFYPQIQQQQIRQIHITNNNNQNGYLSGILYSKQKQIQFAMSSLAAAAEPSTVLKREAKGCATKNDENDEQQQQNKSSSSTSTSSVNSAAPCFNTGFPEILQFMELIGNLKHTKRTGWVLRDVNDCESISGHMYRMSMMTFLLDGTEGLNQVRCMQLALVHDLAESLVGDITPFCGVSKTEKRAMEFKAMDDICKLIEPRGKRIMELFEEYEEGASAESRFVKDLDRLDMVMQAFEYEKRDNCLLKHQEFFDSTEGKFNHPFVKKLVNEIYEQRRQLARSKGATPPPRIHVPDMDAPNGHCDNVDVTSSSSRANNDNDVNNGDDADSVAKNEDKKFTS